MKNLSILIVLGFALFQINCSTDTPTFSILPEEDVFEANEGETSITKIDILWVIDNSGSMADSQNNLAANFSSFIGKFLANNYDYKIAVTTTDAYLGNNSSNEAEYAQFKDGHLPCNGEGGVRTDVRVITPNTVAPEDVINVFLNNIKQGICGSAHEKGLDSMKVALEANLNSGFVREDSFLAVILVTDEADSSANNSQQSIEYLETLTDSRGETKRFSVNAMADWDQNCNGEVRNDYNHLIEATGGIKGDLCGDFADDLEKMGDSILTSATEYFLGRTPKPETIVVTIGKDIVPVAAENPGPTIGGYTYNADKNSITFSGDWLPPQGSIISVVFDTLTLEE